MALFFANNEEIEKVLRVQNLPGGSSAAEIVRFAIMEARSILYTELGGAQLTTLLAGAPSDVDAPSTDAEYLYTIARSVELDLVFYALLGRMQYAAKDSLKDLFASWNTDGEFKSLSPEEIVEKRQDIWANPEYGVSQRLSILKGDQTLGSLQHGGAFTVGTADADWMVLHAYTPHKGWVLQYLENLSAA